MVDGEREGERERVRGIRKSQILIIFLKEARSAEREILVFVFNTNTQKARRAMKRARHNELMIQVQEMKLQTPLVGRPTDRVGGWWRG